MEEDSEVEDVLEVASNMEVGDNVGELETAAGVSDGVYVGNDEGSFETNPPGGDCVEVRMVGLCVG